MSKTKIIESWNEVLVAMMDAEQAWRNYQKYSTALHPEELPLEMQKYMSHISKATPFSKVLPILHTYAITHGGYSGLVVQHLIKKKKQGGKKNVGEKSRPITEPGPSAGTKRPEQKRPKQPESGRKGIYR